MAENRFTEGYPSEHVQIGRSAVRNVTAANVDMEQTAVQRVNADHVNAGSSAAVIVNGATVELRESAAVVVAADYVRAEDSKVTFLLAPRVSGNVTATITLPAAFAFGAGFYVARRIIQGVFGRRER